MHFLEASGSNTISHPEALLYYLTVALNCMYPVIDNVARLSPGAYWLFVYILWGNIYVNFLLPFNLDSALFLIASKRLSLVCMQAS